jgi:hypothetical protein
MLTHVNTENPAIPDKAVTWFYLHSTTSWRRTRDNDGFFIKTNPCLKKVKPRCSATTFQIKNALRNVALTPLSMKSYFYVGWFLGCLMILNELQWHVNWVWKTRKNRNQTVSLPISMFQRTHPVVFIYFLLNPSKHNTNEICIITFNGALLHVSVPGSHHQEQYNKPIPNYWIACYIISALELDSYIHIH